MLNSLIDRIKGARFLVIAKDYLHICTQEVVTQKGTVVKTNDCAAALLGLYEHLEMSKRSEMREGENKQIQHRIGASFLHDCLLGHYSEKTIRDANALLEKLGYITILREKISDNQHDANKLILNIERINFALSELSKIIVGKFYPTVILPYPTVELPHPPYGNFTIPYRKITENNNINNISNIIKNNKEGEGAHPQPQAHVTIFELNTKPKEQDDENDTDYEEILSKLINICLSNNMNVDRWRMRWKQIDLNANDEDLKSLARITANSIATGLMDRYNFETNAQLMTHITTNKKNIQNSISAKYTTFLNNQQGRMVKKENKVEVGAKISQPKNNFSVKNSKRVFLGCESTIEGVYYPILDPNNPFYDSRAVRHRDNTNVIGGYCPYFDPLHELYTEDVRIREREARDQDLYFVEKNMIDTRNI